MTIDERWDFLRRESRRILATFKAGRNPTEAQLNKLESAIYCVELERVCGHRFVDGPCGCEQAREEQDDV